MADVVVSNQGLSSSSVVWQTRNGGNLYSNSENCFTYNWDNITYNCSPREEFLDKVPLTLKELKAFFQSEQAQTLGNSIDDMVENQSVLTCQDNRDVFLVSRKKCNFYTINLGISIVSKHTNQRMIHTLNFVANKADAFKQLVRETQEKLASFSQDTSISRIQLSIGDKLNQILLAHQEMEFGRPKIYQVVNASRLNQKTFRKQKIMTRSNTKQTSNSAVCAPKESPTERWLSAHRSVDINTTLQSQCGESANGATTINQPSLRRSKRLLNKRH